MLSSGDEKGSDTREKKQKREGKWESVVWKDEGLNCALSKHSCGGAVDKRLRIF